jgi:hypothetical protein
VSEPEARQGPSDRIDEKRHVLYQPHIPIPQGGAEEINRLWPEWAQALFPALTEQPHLGRRIEADRRENHVNRFLSAGAGVVQELQKRDIATAEHRGSVNTTEQVLDVGTRQAGHRPGRCSLIWNSQHLLAHRQGRGLFECHKTIQGVKSRESRVTCNRGIATLLFQSFKECENRVAAKIVNAKIHDRATTALGGEGEEAANGIPVCMYRVGTHSASRNQMSPKERLDEVRD